MGENVNEGGMTGYDWDDLEYNSSWDWLMPVVERIENMGYSVRIDDQFAEVTDQEGIIVAEGSGLIKIEYTYETVLSFIKWYNENKTT